VADRKQSFNAKFDRLGQFLDDEAGKQARRATMIGGTTVIRPSSSDLYRARQTGAQS
jgi:hypothetical protein